MENEQSGQSKKRRKARAGSGSFLKLPDGRWRHRFTLHAGRTKDVYGTTQAECRLKRRELEQQAAGGRDVSQRDPKLADFMDDWLTWADNGKRAPSTLAGYRGLIQHHIKPELGQIRISKLTARDVDQMLRQMQKGGLSARTAQQCRTVLNMALKQAMRWDMVARNVASLTESPTVTRKEIKPLTIEQIHLLLSETADDRYGPLYAVAVGTGMRQGELLGLRWEDVDLERRTLHVRQSLRMGKDSRREFGAPKTPKSRRTIVLPSIVVDALEDERRQQEKVRNHLTARWHETGLVFTNGIGRALDGPTVTRSLAATLQALGLPSERAFHGLRHAAATLMAANGVAATVARDILGHTDIAMTLNVYTHSDHAALENAADAIDRALNPPRKAIKTG